MYQFSPLDRSEEIRLLIIHPGRDDDEILCTLSHRNLKTKPPYHALSYTWDSNIRTHGIKISTDVLSVTANLHSAFKRFRNSDQQRTLWVDAICINQDDTQEREKQVRIMGQIYSTATKVLIWLGDGPDNVEEAFLFINKFEDGLDMYSSEVIHSMHRINANNSALWRALSLILNKPWFMRVWIVQEVVLAAHAQVFCGNQSSSWTALKKTVTWIFENNFGSWLQGLPHAHLAIARISVIQNLWCQNQGPTDLSILLFLDLFKYTKSTDPRDKVYALLSLTSDASHIRPDYTISCEELHISIAVDHLDSDIPYVLSCNDYTVNNLGLRLPSWIPNWAAETLQSGLRDIVQFSYTWGFKAAANTQPQWTYSRHDQTLNVTGFVFDNVSHTAEHLYDTSHSLSFGTEDYEARFDHIKTRFQEFDDIAAVSKTYPGKEEFEDACGRLFVLNRPIQLKNGAYPPDQVHRICYQALRDLLLHLDDIKSGKMPITDIANVDTIDPYLLVINQTIPYRRFCATKRHYLGWLPEAGAVGDLVCIFKGAEVPFLLRSVRGAYYKLIGPCYIQGVMYGEGLSSDTTDQVFDIC